VTRLEVRNRGLSKCGGLFKKLFRQRAYVSRNATEKIDNLDRMELPLISKIKNYRKKYSKDPRIIFFDFPRATEIKHIVA
jgi:hypothetical protein